MSYADFALKFTRFVFGKPGSREHQV
jgi:hypothetical protein